MASSEPGRSDLPTGMVTFLFTDIEGSTLLVKTLGADRYSDVLDAHGRILRACVLGNEGSLVRAEGDSFFCVFRGATEAIAAVVAAQRALAACAWPHGATVRVRMGLHSGEAQMGSADSGVDYIGFDVHRAARVAAAGHGGQVLLSETTEALVRDHLPPGATLVDLGRHRFKDIGKAERVWQVDIEGLPSTFPRLKSLDRPPDDLPVQLTSFVGREREIREGARLLGGTRLLTLTGPGGTGKTRLSLQIAAAAADDFPDGIFFVPLEAIVDPDLVVPTIANVLGIQLDARSAPVERLVAALASKRVLVLADNFEQVLGGAPMLAELLRQTPHVKLLVTSRAALRLSGEQELPVPPLGLADPKASAAQVAEHESVQLFVARARATRPDFAVTPDNASAVAAICARLDGLPLAIELAASSIRMLGPAAILARLDKSLALPASGARDLSGRQQTLRGAIAWSYDLLGEPTRRLFNVVSCFAGGGALDDIVAVCGAFCEDDALERLTTLVEHSLVRQHEVEGESRYSMLQTVRSFGLERLAASGEGDLARRRHAEVYLAFAEATAARLMTRERTSLLDRMEREIDNFRTALEWAIGAREGEIAMRLANAIWRVWQARGYLHEARGAIARVLALAADPDSAVLAATWETAGGLAYWQGDLPAARDFYTRALDSCRRRGNPQSVANACYNLSFTWFLGQDVDLDRAAELLDEALTTYRQLGERPGIAKALWARSQIETLRGRPDRSVQGMEESVAIFRSLDDPFGLGWALRSLAWDYLKLQRYAAARTSLEDTLRIFSEGRDVSGITLLLEDFSQLEAAVDQSERAIRLSGAAAALRASSGADLAVQTREMFAKFEADRKLSPEAAQAAWTAGMQMGCDEAVAYALAGRGVGAA